MNLVIAAEIGPKTFQCNFTQPPIPGAIELLNAAAGALSLMLDKATGQPSFKIQQRLQRMPSEPDGYYAIATGVYPVAGTTGSVRLGLNAIGEGRVGTRLVVVFQDLMGWALPSAEEFVDVGMQTIAYGLASIPNDGWRMIEGRWRHAHRFDAPGVTDEGRPAQAPASIETGDLPEGLLNSPTDRAFRNHLPGMSAEETRQILATALRDAWALESSNFGVELTLLARNRAWPRQVLGIRRLVRANRRRRRAHDPVRRCRTMGVRGSARRSGRGHDRRHRGVAHEVRRVQAGALGDPGNIGLRLQSI